MQMRVFAGGESSLNSIPKVFGDNSVLLASIGMSLVDGLADIDPVAEKVIQRAPAEGAPTLHPPLGGLPLLAVNIPCLEICSQRCNRLQLQEPLEYAPHLCGLGLVDGQ